MLAAMRHILFTALRLHCLALEKCPGINAELRDLADESLNLLKGALASQAARFPALFDLRVYGSIIGMFELNNLGEAKLRSACLPIACESIRSVLPSRPASNKAWHYVNAA